MEVVFLLVLGFFVFQALNAYVGGTFADGAKLYFGMLAFAGVPTVLFVISWPLGVFGFIVSAATFIWLIKRPDAYTRMRLKMQKYGELENLKPRHKPGSVFIDEHEPPVPGAEEWEQAALREIAVVEALVMKPSRFPNVLKSGERKADERYIKRLWEKATRVMEYHWAACARVDRAIYPLLAAFQGHIYIDSIEASSCTCWTRTITPEEWSRQGREMADRLMKSLEEHLDE